MKTSDRFFMGLIGLLVLLGFFTSIAMLSMRAIPVENKDPLMLLVGSLATMAGMVVGYWYGSSHGSSMKTDLLAGAPDHG